MYPHSGSFTMNWHARIRALAQGLALVVALTMAPEGRAEEEAENRNRAAVAEAIQKLLDGTQPSEELRAVLDEYVLATPEEQELFLQQLAGEIGTANLTAALQSNSSFTSLALSQLASSSFSARSNQGGKKAAAAPPMASFGMASTASGFGMPSLGNTLSGMPGGDDAVLEDHDSVWVLGTGFWGDIDPTAVNQGFEYDGSGFVLGYTFGDEDHNSWKWGVQGGFNQSDIDTVGALDNSDVDSWNVGLHGSYFEDGDYANLVAGYNNNEFDTTRIFNTPIFTATSRASFEADERFAYGEIGHIYDLDDEGDDVAQATTVPGVDDGVEPYNGEGWHAAPQLALQYRNYEQDAYTTTGAGVLDQQVGPVGLDMFQSALGVRLFHTSRTDEGGWLVPEIMARWGHEFGDIDRTVRANFVGTNEVFTINGVRPDRDTVQLRAGVAAYTAKDWNFDLSYNGEFSENVSNQAGVAKATWFFD